MATILLAALVSPGSANAQDPVGSALTYQGQLMDSGSPADGTYNMRFLLFDVPEGGTALDTYPDEGEVAVDVQEGLFSLQLEFDGALFDGNRRWLEIVVEGMCLSPRQELTATPYALYALNGGEGFSLPFEGQVETSQTAFSVTNLGSGKTAYLRNFAGDNTNATLWVQHNGLGTVGYFLTYNNESGNATIRADNNGLGRVAYLLANNSDSTNSTLLADNHGLGRTGQFSTLNSANDQATVEASTYGTGPALFGRTTGSGAAVKSQTTGTGHAGYFWINNTDNDEGAVLAETNGEEGRAVVGHALNTANALNYGGYFLADGGSGVGVYGKAPRIGYFTNYGGYFEAAGNTGIGVLGQATATGEAWNYGGYFNTAATYGTGVYARANGTYGTGIHAEGGSSGYAAELEGDVNITGDASIDGDVLMHGFQLTDSPVDGWVLTSDASGVGSWQPAAGSLWSVNGDDIYNDNSGNVGIGTSTPGRRLDVDGKVVMERLDSGGGWIRTLGPGHASMNVQITNLADWPSNGYVAVHDSGNNLEAGMYVTEDGVGRIFADIKNARMPNPNQEGTEIWYACPEGPEAAAYVRGTAELANGRAEVTLPEHFVAVAGPHGITVQVTPLSAESKGLAVVEKHADGFVVRELFNGTGTYDFDYTVMAVRKGYEDYRVIRPASEGLPAEPTEIDQGSE